MKTIRFALGIVAVIASIAAHAANRPAGYVTACTESKPTACPSVPANTNVAYGRSDHFTYKLISGSFVCQESTFGSGTRVAGGTNECSIPGSSASSSSSSPTSRSSSSRSSISSASSSSRSSSSASSSSSSSRSSSSSSSAISSSSSSSSVVPGTTVISYIGSSAILTNPERGFDHQAACEGTNLGLSTLTAYRNNGFTLIHCMFYLTNFTGGPISQSVLDKLQSQLNVIRTAGLKVILRFAYTKSTVGGDAPVSVVLQHLDQLAPYLAANEDILYVLQSGFIGAWGEWYYTKNYGNVGVMSTTDWTNRKAIVDKELAVLPASRMVQLRTLQYKMHMYSASPIAPAQAFNGSPIARIGHHNDAFVADATDMGTYTNVATDYPYLQAETRYLPMGGESEYSDPNRAQCSNALAEMEMFHWSYANMDWNPNTVKIWSDGGCLDTMKKRLGYRYVLTEGAFANTATVGGSYQVQLGIRNDGYASLFNARRARLVLRSTTSPGTTYSFNLSSDPRWWLPGTTTHIDEAVTLAGVPAGRYELLLALPDASASLSTRPEYAIQLANTGTWEPATGLNRLLMTISVQ